MHTLNEFVNTKSIIDIPKGSLGILRSQMPQIQSKDLPNFIKWLNKNGISSKKETVSVNTLKLTQNDINKEKVKTMIDSTPDEILSKPIIVSNDHHILDGHHRFVALLNKNKNLKIPTIKVNLSMKELLKKAHEFPQSFTKSINEGKLYSQFITEQNLLLEKLIIFGGKAYPKFGNVVILAGGAGCYPHYTEFFNGKEWKYISEYNDSDNVLQYDLETNIASLTSNVEYVKLNVDSFTNIKNRRLDFTTSEYHNHLVINEKTKQYETIRTHELVKNHNEKVRGNKCKLVTSFKYNGDGVDISDDEIRLMVAIIADGHYLPRKTMNKCIMSFSKERKIERFRELLNINNIIYREYIENNFTRFEFEFNNDEKEFESYWYNCTSHQLSVVCDEVLKWVGSGTKRKNRKDNKIFSSNSKKSIDFIQFAFSASEKDVSIYVDERERYDNTCYSITINSSKGVGISKNNRGLNTTSITKLETNDDENMYCFSVPKGFFVVRQYGKIYVSGNSGKGFTGERLLGIEGKIFDVDALKKLVIASTNLAASIKKSTGVDIKNLSLKNPENVAILHGLIADQTKVLKGHQGMMFKSIASADNDRKPNILFDVTLKDEKKLATISKDVLELGYKKENIHIVWVLNDIKVAIDQNAGRDRVVPSDILLNTHQGANATMKDILDSGNKVKRYMDGDIWISFNKVGVDSNLKKSDKGGSYVVDSEYIKVKAKGQSPISPNDLTSIAMRKILTYVPNPEVWGLGFDARSPEKLNIPKILGGDGK